MKYLDRPVLIQMGLKTKIRDYDDAYEQVWGLKRVIYMFWD
jgi:hypothetical protein